MAEAPVPDAAERDSGKGETAATIDVTTRFAILDSSPQPNSNKFLPDAPIKLTFSAPVAPASVNASAFQLREVGGGEIPFSVTSEGTVVTLKPAMKLDLLTTVMVSVAASVRSVAGETLLSEHQFQFRVVDGKWTGPIDFDGVVPGQTWCDAAVDFREAAGAVISAAAAANMGPRPLVAAVRPPNQQLGPARAVGQSFTAVGGHIAIAGADGVVWVLSTVAADQISASRFINGAWASVGTVRTGPRSWQAFQAQPLPEGRLLVIWSQAKTPELQDQETLWAATVGKDGWGAAAMLGGTTGLVDGVATSAAGDSAIVVWREYGEGDFVIFARRFDRSGWRPLETIAPRTSRRNDLGQIMVALGPLAIALSTDGQAVFVQKEVRPPQSTALVVLSQGKGGNWSPFRTIHSTAATGLTASGAISVRSYAGGTFAAAWNLSGKVWFARSTSSDWKPLTLGDTAAHSLGFDVDSRGNASLMWVVPEQNGTERLTVARLPAGRDDVPTYEVFPTRSEPSHSSSNLRLGARAGGVVAWCESERSLEGIWTNFKLRLRFFE
ncbi:MAG TPA: Ig-like domain-containing protein [Polyangia bacterium]